MLELVCANNNPHSVVCFLTFLRGNILEIFGEYIAKAMRVVHKSFKNGHLIMSTTNLENRIKKSQNIKNFANSGESREGRTYNTNQLRQELVSLDLDNILQGSTTHKNLFSQYPGKARQNCEILNSKKVLLAFRLKKNQSASEALEKLLTSGKTYLDCGAAVTLAQYLAVKMAFEDKYGQKKGRERFDFFFGSKEKNIPTVQRLLFSAFGALSGTADYHNPGGKYNELIPFNPLSFIFEIKKIQNNSIKLSDMRIGSHVAFWGNKNYTSKHPAGGCRLDNCIVANHSAGSKGLLYFTGGETPVSEKQLTTKYVKVYNKPPTDGDKLMTIMCDTKSDPKLSQIKEADIPGVDSNYYIDVCDSSWNEMLNDAKLSIAKSLKLSTLFHLMKKEGTRKSSPTYSNRSILPENREFLNFRKFAIKKTIKIPKKLPCCLTIHEPKKDEEYHYITGPSHYFYKEIRVTLGLTRKAIRKNALSLEQMEQLKKKFQPMTIYTDRTDTNRYIITAPKDIYREFLVALDKLQRECLNEGLSSSEPPTTRFARFT